MGDIVEMNNFHWFYRVEALFSTKKFLLSDSFKLAGYHGLKCIYLSLRGLDTPNRFFTNFHIPFFKGEGRGRGCNGGP